MADIELVIKIPEKTVNEIRDNVMFAGSISSDIRWNVTNAIVNGTPLPKGHGKLVDVKQVVIALVFHDFLKDNVTCGDVTKILDMATIIEADKGEADDNRESNSLEK